MSHMPPLFERLPRAIAKHGLRARKRLVQQTQPGPRAGARPVFIMGCQRSGTKMTLETLSASPRVWTHDHRSVDPVYFFKHDPAYAQAETGSLARLNSPEELKRLVEKTRAHVVAFHSVAEAQRTPYWLDRFKGARSLWIYRRYPDVANSAVKLWGDHQKDLIRRVHDGEWESLKWRGERLDPRTVAQVSAMYHDNLSAYEGAALFWYIRNQFFFALNLGQDERVLLIRYEDLVAQPEVYWPKVFEFIGCPFRPRYTANIFASSVGERSFPEINPDVKALCDGLLRQLDDQYQAGWKNAV